MSSWSSGFSRRALLTTLKTTMPSPVLDVLYEDNHLLALNKPAGLPTMGTPEGTPTLLTLAKEYVGKVPEAGQRLSRRRQLTGRGGDRRDPLRARTSKAAARLSEQFRTQAVQKTYWALVEAAGKPGSGSYVDWLVHDERHRRVHVAEKGQAGGEERGLSFRQIAQAGRFSLLEIELETGRKHQIRVQLAHHGQPIIGDRKYGSAVKFPQGIALHARRLVIAHPVRGDTLEFIAPLPRYWRSCVSRLESTLAGK